MSQKEEVINSAEESKPRGLRVKPTIFIGVAIYLIYLAIFYGTWAINGVDYPRIGESATTAKLWYAMPTLLGSAFVAIAVTALGWWRVSLFDKVKSGPKWFWIMPVAMILVIIGSYATTQLDNLSSQLLIWCILGGLGVGFGEEMITRGSFNCGVKIKTNRRKGVANKYSVVFGTSYSKCHFWFAVEPNAQPINSDIHYGFGVLCNEKSKWYFNINYCSSWTMGQFCLLATSYW
jgi:hypothetical protein